MTSTAPPADSIFSFAVLLKAWALTVRALSRSPSARTFTRDYQDALAAWSEARAGPAPVVIGPRSAAFAPLAAAVGLRLYDVALLRQTERQLIAESVLIGEALRAAA